MRDSSRPASRRIVFYDRPGWERLSPAAIDRTGLGGSETALVRVAAALAARGHDVTVYADTFEGVVDGVTYRPCERWDPGDPVDAVVVSRLPELFDHEIAAPIRVLWCHDAFYNGLTPERAGRMTSVVVLSDWQRDVFARRYPPVADKLRIIRNGIRLYDDDGRGLYEGRASASESALRAASTPRCPAAGSMSFSRSGPRSGGGFRRPSWTSTTAGRSTTRSPSEVTSCAATRSSSITCSSAQAARQAAFSCEAALSQPELHAAMARARVWSYPTAAPETSCISAMEARAAGLAIVTSDFAALSETVGHDHGVLIPVDEGLIRFEEPQPRLELPNHTAEYQAAFVDAVAELLVDADAWAHQHARALRGVESPRLEPPRGGLGAATASGLGAADLPCPAVGRAVAPAPQYAESGCAIAHGPRAGGLCSTTGLAGSSWSPAAIDGRGLGGSETALVRVAAALAARGHDVTVYASTFEGVVDGVTYRPCERWNPGDPVDAVVVSRVPEVFDHEIAAPIRVLWCHDAYYTGLTPERAGRMTSVVVLSDWQRDLFARRYPSVEDKLRIVRNGIRLYDDDGRALYEGAERAFADRAPRCIYSSLPNRGLDVLLEVWPEIRRRVPDAELDVYYGWEVYDQIAEHDHRLRGYKVLLYHLLERAGGEAGGVVMRGRVSQPELHAAMARARVWSYPTAFPETSCISAMEARAAGLAIVTSDLAALSETVGNDHGVLIPIDERRRSAFRRTSRWSRRRTVRTSTGPPSSTRSPSCSLDEDAWTHAACPRAPRGRDARLEPPGRGLGADTALGRASPRVCPGPREPLLPLVGPALPEARLGEVDQRQERELGRVHRQLRPGGPSSSVRLAQRSTSSQRPSAA